MKMLIDKIKLKLLLEEKRDYINHSIDGIDIVISENLDEVIHKFSIVAVKDNYNEYANRFLLYYDTAWKCWFFSVFIHQNEENIIQRLSNKLKIDTKYIKVQYISDRLQPKFSEKDQIHKVYQHSLFQGYIAQFPPNMKQDEFEIDGTKYRWWTIQEMEDDKTIMKVNRDVVSFVKEKIR